VTSPDGGWRALPPTRRQLEWIGAELGWPPERAKGRTRGEISDLIGRLRANRALLGPRARPSLDAPREGS